MHPYLDLLDYRRQVASLYARVRQLGSAHPEAHAAFRRERDRLFATHPQSPLSPTQRTAFSGLRYYPYDPALRFVLEPDLAVERESFDLTLRDDGPLTLTRFAKVHFELLGERVSLSLFWLEGYGGGLFLPFRDGTNGKTTYGGGRYLLDTVKGADLGEESGKLVLDFNYAYHPSCAYHPRWACPLAPPENRLTQPVEAGEKGFA